MKLVYCWIESYRNIKNQGFNFGSEYIYEHELIVDEIILSRKENKDFLHDLFKNEHDGFENITAIVGENGVGKTNFIYILLMCLKGKWNRQGIFFIFEIEGKIEIIHNLKNNRNSFFDSEDINSSEKYRIIAQNFDFNEKSIYEFKNNEIVYYSPICDFDKRFTDETSFVNVSSNFYATKDTNDYYPSTYRENFHALDFHLTSEVSRIIFFLQSITVDKRRFIESKITIPKEVDISFFTTKTPYDDEREPYNLNISFRFFLRDDYDKNNIWGNEITKITNSQGDFEGKKESETYQNIMRWKSYVTILRNFFYGMINDANINNTFLLDSLSDSMDAVEKGTFNKTIDFAYLTKEGKSNYENFFITFIENQQLFNKSTILPLIYQIKKTIFQIDITKHSWDQDSKISCTLSEAQEILSLYNNYIRQPTYITNKPLKIGIIDFSWQGLSSGERAFLNLFSRFYAAHCEIEKRTNKHLFENNRKDYPKNVYLFVDEGELGFHFQWQKEYILNLVEITPLIFNKGTLIQLILATHSPISLSDLPNKHIIYLNDYRATHLIVPNISNTSNQ